jgi:hypothetical protein
MGWYQTQIAREAMASARSRSMSRRLSRRACSASSKRWQRLRPRRLASYSASSEKLSISATEQSRSVQMPTLTPSWPP